MVAKYLSFIAFILFVGTVVFTPVVKGQSVEKSFSKSTPRTTTYINKTTANGRDDCDAICQFQRKLREVLLSMRQTINYVNKTTDDGWDDCDANCQFQRKLRQVLLSMRQTINYVNKTTDDGWDDCDANCQFQRKLRQELY